MPFVLRMDLLTSELQASKLKGDEAVANLYKVHQSIQIVWGQNEAVTSAEVSPAAQEEVSTQAVLQGASKVLVEDGVQIVVIRAWRRKDKQKDCITACYVTDITSLQSGFKELSFVKTHLFFELNSSTVNKNINSPNLPKWLPNTQKKKEEFQLNQV